MSCSFTLVESTPLRLRYLCTTTDGAGGSDVLGNSITNPTPNLYADLAPAAGPLRELVCSATVAQADARAVFCGEHPVATAPAITNVVRAHAHIQSRGVAAAWAVDADIAGTRPVLRVYSPAVQGVYAYLDLVVTPSPHA
jgi:hypothetical protein